MNLENEFDELARQKLEGRSIPFEENDWSRMQTLLNAQKRDRLGRIAMWLGGAALLAVLFTGAWLAIGPNTIEKDALVQHGATASEPADIDPSADVQGALIIQEKVEVAIPMDTKQEENQKGTSTEISKVGEVALLPANTPNTATPNASARSAERASSNTPAEVRSAIAEKNVVNVGDANAETNDAINTSASVPTTTTTNNSIVSDPGNSIPSETTDHTVPRSMDHEPRSDVQYILEAASNSEGPDQRMGSTEPQSSSRANFDVEEIDAKDDLLPPVFMTRTVTENSAMNATEEELKSDEIPPLEVPSTTGSKPMNAPIVQPNTTASSIGPAADTIASYDSTELAQMEPEAATPEPQPIAPLITPRSPWEIGLFVGAMNTTSSYSGANSSEWKGGIEREWTTTAGLELMHLGRNFGLGAGVHYSTYSERVNIEAIDRTTMMLHDYWYLNPVDTTILFITDTIPGDSVDSYVGQSVDVTLNVLTQGIDTITTNEHVRDARSVLNKVSYLEIPLLLDAHLVQGRWSLGVRGGPTIGVVTGRKGSLPSPNGEGFVDFKDQQFRDVVFGWTARAYVRYRFNAAWSIGVEPMMRGQLFNTMGSGELSRKSTGLGGLISLSYLLK